MYHGKVHLYMYMYMYMQVHKKEGDKTGMNGCMLPW